MRPYGSPAQLEQRRLRTIALFKEGLPPVTIAAKLGVERRSVRRWKASYLKTGRKGIKAKPASGRPSRLDIHGKKTLDWTLIRGAHRAGYATDLWTCPRVTELIRQRFGVEYHARYVPRLLRPMGWTPQKPEHRARERDEKAIRHWVRVEWPRIKKQPAA